MYSSNHFYKDSFQQAMWIVQLFGNSPQEHKEPYLTDLSNFQHKPNHNLTHSSINIKIQTDIAIVVWLFTCLLSALLQTTFLKIVFLLYFRKCTCVRHT